MLQLSNQIDEIPMKFCKWKLIDPKYSTNVINKQTNKGKPLNYKSSGLKGYNYKLNLAKFKKKMAADHVKSGKNRDR